MLERGPGAFIARRWQRSIFPQAGKWAVIRGRWASAVFCKKEARAIDKGVLTASQLATQPTNQPLGVPASPPVVKLGQPVTDQGQSVSKVEPAG